jgi:thioredoxin reductase (NADPH)
MAASGRRGEVLMAEAELLIVGGGVAGLTAGLYAVRAGLDVLLLERMGTGGQMINIDRVENFPGFPGGIKGYELGPLVAQQAMDAGLRIEYAEAQAVCSEQGGYSVATDGDTYHARAVILAAGSTLARLSIPGEEQFEGRGVSQCAVCDGEFFRDQPVAVIGGGDSALDEALVLAEIASDVTVVHRRSSLRAAHVLAERAMSHPRVRFRWDTVVEAIEGDETVSALRVRGLDGAVDRIGVNAVFVYVGLRPNSHLLGDLVALDAGGHVPVDLWMRTTLPGLLAAGDIRQRSARQFIASAGDGATAALAAERYLRGGEWRGV